MTELTRAVFQQLDHDDPLARYRTLFELPENLIYLDGNSLGALPVGSRQRARDVVDEEWGQGLIRSWNAHRWIDLPGRLGDKLAPLIGAQAGEVLISDSTSVNLFKLGAAALRMRPGRHRILSEQGNFPTDLYMMQGLQAFSAGSVELQTVARGQLLESIDEDTAVVVLTHVHYKTGQLWDMPGLTRRAHEAGALVLWDLSHSAGALPVDLNGAQADMAVGCGYKYLNGGPGAPAYLFVAERHHAEMRNPLSGWFGHAAPFDFEDDYRPAEGISCMQCGTPGVVGAALLEVGIDLFSEVDIHQVREKSRKLGDLFIQLVNQRCPEFVILSPTDAKQRGSHVSICHRQGYAIMQALIARGVIGDFRDPDVLRFGFTPLYTRYVDVFEAVEALAGVIRSEAWTQSEFQARSRVT